MLPKLKLRHQSIMHDYMFGSARKAQVIKAKTFKWFFMLIFSELYLFFDLKVEQYFKFSNGKKYLIIITSNN